MIDYNVTYLSLCFRCGALHVGDQILSIDGVAMGEGVTMMSVREASEMLHNGMDTLKLEILPISHLQLATIKPPMGKPPPAGVRRVAGAEHGFTLDSIRFPSNWGTSMIMTSY